MVASVSDGCDGVGWSDADGELRNARCFGEGSASANAGRRQELLTKLVEGKAQDEGHFKGKLDR